MTTTPLILIHGAWHSASCWQPLAAALTAHGQTIYTPDLPGHGKSKRPIHQVTLAAYTESLIALIQSIAKPVRLLGHSMAGIVISQVAEELPDHIEELIYLSAYIPKHNQSLLSIAKSARSHGLSPYLTIDPSKGEIRIKPCDEVRGVLYNCSSEQDAIAAQTHLQPQALQPFNATVTLSDTFARVKKRAIVCKQDRTLAPEDQLSMCQGVIDTVIEIESDHCAFVSTPQILLDILSQEN